MLKYTDITQNTYVQGWTVTEIKAREKCGLFAVPRTVPGSRDVIPIRCALCVLVYSRLKRVPRCACTCNVLGNPKDNYDISASVFVVQFNDFMSLTSYVHYNNNNNNNNNKYKGFKSSGRLRCIAGYGKDLPDRHTVTWIFSDAAAGSSELVINTNVWKTARLAEARLIEKTGGPRLTAKLCEFVVQLE